MSVDGLTGDETLARSGAMALLVADLLLIAVTALKGKYPTALLGVFISPLAWVGAVRMARPTSPWARWWYGEHRTRRARERAERFDRRWGSLRRRWDHLIAGAPSLPPRRGPG